MPVLAGDVGGTKTWLQIADFSQRRYVVLHERLYANQSYDSLTPIIQDFLKGADAVSLEAACFGVAGPVNVTVDGQHTHLTNLPWLIDNRAISTALHIPKVRLVNDFQAVGYGIEALHRNDLVTLQAGTEKRHGARGLIGAGTGLGQGFLTWQGDHYEAWPTEGGHVDFAPIDETQIELLRYLIRLYGRASYERVLSGPGLVNVYRFFHQHAPLPADIAESLDPAPLITAAALEGKDPIAVRALDTFVTVYGAQAGNLALSVLASGGVYIAGGIAPRITRQLADGRFMRAFVTKGRLSPWIATVPVHIIVNPKVGLMGAALAASRL